MLERMEERGEVAVSHRVGRERVWDAAERIFPDDDPVPLGEALRTRDARRLASLGLVRPQGPACPVEPMDVGEAGLPARVVGVKGMWRVDPTLPPAVANASYGEDVLRGTWEYVVPPGEFHDAISADVGLGAEDVRIFLSFDGPHYAQGFVLDGEIFRIDGVIEGDGGVFTLEGDRVTMLGAGGTGTGEFTWGVDGDDLAITAIAECDLVHSWCETERGALDPMMLDVMEHTYTRVSDEPTW